MPSRTDQQPALRPSPPFVVVTRKGSFPAATAEEARVLMRGSEGDSRAAVTDGRGNRWTVAAFFAALDRPEVAPTGPAKAQDFRSWAASTADIDLDGVSPPGWTPPAAKPSPPAKTGSAGKVPAASKRPISDRQAAGRHSDRGFHRPTKTSSGPAPVVIVAIVMVAAGLIFTAWLLFGR